MNQEHEATLKSLSGFRDISLNINPFGEFVISSATKRLNYGKFPENLTRSVVDRAAFRLKYHDPLLHITNRPEGELENLIYDQAENIRTDIIGARSYSGVKCNIAEFYNIYAMKNGYQFFMGKENIPYTDILLFILLELLAGIKYPEFAQSMMSLHEEKLLPIVMAYQDKLLESLYNQQDFGDVIKKIIEKLQEGEQHSENVVETDYDISTKEGERKNSAGTEEEAASDVDKQTAPDSVKSEKMLQMQKDNPEEGKGKPENYGVEEVVISNELQDYRVYTTEFDEIITPLKLYNKQILNEARKQLDIRLKELQKITQKQANQLVRKFMAKRNISYDYNQEEGVLDSRLLPYFIAASGNQNIYKLPKLKEEYNTVVSLLLDNSGSMRGKPIAITAMSADILAKTLEKCSIKVEVLGFTTADWRGGAAKKLWEQKNRPKDPGRLNDIRHIIYKAADNSWVLSKNNLGLMLKDGVLKENIDGEALLFALERLNKRQEPRKILIIISDGAPSDDSTSSTNAKDYLESHLKAVIEYIEKKTKIQLVAIGIGHDVGRYYSNAVVIKDALDLGNVIFNKLADIL